MTPHTTIALACLAFAIAGCDRETTPTPAPSPDASASPSPSPSKSPASVLRDDVEIGVEAPAPAEPFHRTVPFADGGFTLGKAADAAIAAIVASENFAGDGGIVLRGHTDSVGHDEANLRSSRKRAEAVAEALVAAGADPERIRVIALGEMRPLAPNAKLDGTPDEDGRARNRRVDVTIAPPSTATEPTDRQSEPPSG